MTWRGATLDFDRVKRVAVLEGEKFSRRQCGVQVGFGDQGPAGAQEGFDGEKGEGHARRAQPAGPVPVAHPQPVKEAFLDVVLGDERQREVRGEPPRERGLARARQPGDDDE